MGKRNRQYHGSNKGRKGDFKKKKRSTENEEWIYTNEKFVAFYKLQEIVSNDEWDAFMDLIAKPLPVTFRINSSFVMAESLRNEIKENFRFDNLEIDGEKISPLGQMVWYPNENGFQWAIDKRKVRKLPELAAFQKWMVKQTEYGNITRQEAVSMIPPLVLGVEPHHKVLDMCASPGSKTSQLLELIHLNDSASMDISKGMVIANDVDQKRAHLLVHQTKRIGSPALAVCISPAQYFPLFGDHSNEPAGTFDRILADVPCTGDGTTRKNPDIWLKWDPRNAFGIHPLQLQIATRGLNLLKVGGMMCYSTCSYNPIENEAVVAELLRRYQGALELVDLSTMLPGLIRRPGMNHWKVVDSDMIIVDSVENPSSEETVDRKKPILKSMFPPSSEEAKQFHLERCMRCIPLDQDTGGFFICLLKKTKEIVAEVIPSTCTKSKKQSEKEEYLRIPSDIWSTIKTYYGINDMFSSDLLYTRSSTCKNISYVTRTVKETLLDHIDTKNCKIPVVHAGQRIFQKVSKNSEAVCPYRFNQEGLHIILPYVTKRRIELPLSDFQMLLDKHKETIPFHMFSDSIANVFKTEEIGSFAGTLGVAKEDNPSLTKSYLYNKMNLVIWRGRQNISVEVTELEVDRIKDHLKTFGIYKTFYATNPSEPEPISSSISTISTITTTPLKEDIIKEDNIIAKEDNIIAKEDNIIAKEDNIIAKEDNIIIKEDNIIVKEDNIATSS